MVRPSADTQRVAILVLLLIPVSVAAQSIKFDRYDSRSGLPHNLVQSVVQDRDGFLWIGTIAGLARFDGVSFTVFTHAEDDSESLSSNSVTALAVSNDGSLWVGTGTGLDRYDPIRARFERVDLPNATIEALTPDPFDGVWVLTQSHELYHVRDWLQSDTLSFVATNITSVAADSNSVVWATKQNEKEIHSTQLLQYNRSLNRLETLRTLTNEPDGPTVVGDGAGAVWLRNVANPDSSCTPQLRCLPGGLSATGGPLVYDSSVRLWIGSASGLVVATADSLISATIDPSPGAWLSNTPQSITTDRAGGIWIATLSGLYHFNPESRPFANIDFASAPGLRDGAAMAVVADHEGAVWVGALGRGLLRLPSHRVRSTVASINATGFIWALHEDPTGTIWTGMAQDGLCGYRPGQPPNCFDIPAAMISEDSNGRMWLGANHVQLFDPRLQTILARFEWPSPLTPIGGSILADSPDSIWVGADGLYHCDIHGSCARPSLEEQQRLRFDNLGVFAISNGPDPYLWLGTTRGLARYDRENRTFRTYFDDPTMEARIVYSILRDAGELWLGTNRGLVRFRHAENQFRVFDADEAPGFPEYNRRAAFRGPDGTMYFGHLDGVTVFTPSEIRENTQLPTTVITGVGRVGADGPASFPVDAAKPIEITHRDRLIRFDFAAPSFTHADGNRFRYRLHGIDDDWIQAGSDRFAVFTSLPAGRYTFQVQGSNSDGLWSESPAEMMLHVAPPFWDRWWFRTFALLVISSVLALAHRSRIRQLVRVEQVRTRIATDLHDEVGSKLAALALSSETLSRRGQLSATERFKLNEMAATARRTVDDLRDVVWLASPHFDSLGDLVEKMRTTADAILAGIPHDFECVNPESIENLDPNQRRQLFLFFKEIVRNTARHSNATFTSISLDCRGRRLRLCVADNGTGFDTSTTREATGLAGLRSRAMALRGTMSLETSAHSGTTIILDAPLGRIAGSRDSSFLSGFLRL